MENYTEVLEEVQAYTDQFPNIVYAFNTDGSIIYYNKKWEEITGSRPDGSANSHEEYIHNDDQERYRDFFKSFLRKNEKKKVSYRIKLKDGSYSWFRDEVAPVFENGRPVYWIGTLFNIDDLVQNKDSGSDGQFAGKEKEDFLFKIAHDLKGPVSNMEALITILEEQCSENAADLIPLFQQSVEKLRSRIKELTGR